MVFEKIYKAVKRISKGKVATYGQIGKQVGTSPRVVGNALHQNPDPKNIPCHRVVDRNGRLAPNYGFSSRGRPSQNRPSRRVRIELKSREVRLGGGGWRKQRRKLLAEGVKFKDSTHVDLKKHLISKV